MRVRLALLDTDSSYLNRFISSFNNKYSDNIEIHLFSKIQAAIDELNSTKIDVFLASDSFDIPEDILPSGCGFAYLTDISDTATVKGRRSLFKHQKIDSLYNAIMDIYSDNGYMTFSENSAEPLPVYVFTSAAGGVGTTHAAISCARSFVLSDIPTLYISFEKIGNPSLYLSGANPFNLSDCFYTIKSKKANLPLKLKSNLSRDVSGLYWIPFYKNPLDWQDIKKSDLIDFLVALTQTDVIKRVVLDLNFNMDDYTVSLFELATTLIFVTDGSETSNTKLNIAYDTLKTVEKIKGFSFTKNKAVFCNKFSNKTGRLPEISDLQSIGGASKIENAASEQIISHIIQSGRFAEL